MTFSKKEGPALAWDSEAFWTVALCPAGMQSFSFFSLCSSRESWPTIRKGFGAHILGSQPILFSHPVTGFP